MRPGSLRVSHQPWLTAAAWYARCHMVTLASRWCAVLAPMLTTAAAGGGDMNASAAAHYARCGADSVLLGCAAAAGGVQVKGKGWMDTFLWKP